MTNEEAAKINGLYQLIDQYSALNIQLQAQLDHVNNDVLTRLDRLEAKINEKSNTKTNTGGITP